MATYILNNLDLRRLRKHVADTLTTPKLDNICGGTSILGV